MSLHFVHGVSESDLHRLANRLRGLHGRSNPVAYVAVFGSRVKGTHRKDSDLDIVLVFYDGASSARTNPRIVRVTSIIKEEFLQSTGITLDLNLFDVQNIGPKTKFKLADLHKLDF